MPVHTTKEYRAWVEMKRRCYNKRRKNYKLYGGRGISVCDRWRYSFRAFLSDVGYAPSLQYTLDRINTDGNYEPGNVRWATIREQANNVRHNSTATVFGTTKSASDWARDTGKHPATIRYRLRSGIPDAEAITAPVKPWRRLIELDGKSHTAKEWSRILGIPVSTINYRFRNSIPINKEK